MISGITRSGLCAGPYALNGRTTTIGHDRPRWSIRQKRSPAYLLTAYGDSGSTTESSLKRDCDVAVDLARARVDEPLVAAPGESLEQVHGPVDVRLDALVDAVPGLADVRVGTEVEHDPRVGPLDDRGHGSAVVEVARRGG